MVLHLIDICFIPCICSWQISQIQTCLCVVVGPGFVSKSPAFMRSSHSTGPHHRLSPPKKTVNRGPLLRECGFDTICTAACQNPCDSSTIGCCVVLSLYFNVDVVVYPLPVRSSQLCSISQLLLKPFFMMLYI